MSPTWTPAAYDHDYRLERDRALERAAEAERALALHGRALREIRAYIERELEDPPVMSVERAALRAKQRATALRMLRTIIQIINRHEDDLVRNRRVHRLPRWRGTENGPRPAA